jgi:lipopolysaccharide biosynthesis glycosyltransferase
MRPRHSIWIGYDPREAGAYAVARETIQRNTLSQIPIRGVVLQDLKDKGLYYRPTSKQDGRLWDDISEAPMATEFAISRFLVPHLAGDGWALFVDADVMARKNIDRIFSQADPSKAVMVVKHNHQPHEGGLKMDGQAQLRYARKNWSSVCLWNVDHPANKALTIDMINSVPGRDLHAFNWLPDELIGALDPKWNFLVGESDPSIDPAIVHFTSGIPTMVGYENCAFATEWRDELKRWAS